MPGSPKPLPAEALQTVAVVECDVTDARADLDTVDAVCRAALVAGRGGAALVIRGASTDLIDLLAFLGLERVARANAVLRSGVEPRGQPEQREESLRIEKERDAADPPV